MKRYTIIFFLLVTISCGETYTSSIPDVHVNYTCSLLDNPTYKIKTPGYFISVMNDNHYMKIGYGGLIIGQSIYGYFIAFDAACPVEVNRNISVEVIEDAIGTAICPVCQTKYHLSEGGFPEGANGEYLKRYKVTLSGDKLIITN